MATNPTTNDTSAAAIGATPITIEAPTEEHRTLLETLAKHRAFLRHTVIGLTDEQAGTRSTVSELTLGGIVKHVTGVERRWTTFVLEGPPAMSFEYTPEAMEEWADEMRILPGETLEGLLAGYDEVARRTNEVIAAQPDLSASHPLPEAPWFEPGGSWSVRRVLLHMLAETAQHSGHADIIREAIDGQKTMG